MTTPTTVTFSQRVLDTLNSLPAAERSTIAAALTGEFLLGLDPMSQLPALQRIIYVILRQYVRQDMRRASQAAYDFTR